MSVRRLESAFEQARSADRQALIPFLMSGHPTPEAFEANLNAAGEYADVIEVGIPFSDPLADGPVIQSAAATALKNGTTLASTLSVLERREPGPPVVLMLSFNQVLAGGVSRFAERAAAAGISGAIVPDLPFEEQGEVREIFTRQGLALIPMLAPTTSLPRMQAILERARGFVYLISVAGVTGARTTFPPATHEYVQRAASMTVAPVCVGFGISSASHIAELRDCASGFIVGSALIRGLEEGKSVGQLLDPLREACMAGKISTHGTRDQS